MKRLLLLVAIMIAFWPMKTIEGSIHNAYTEPNQPTDKDLITIVIDGVEGQGPVLITDSNLQITGTSLEIDISLNVGPFTEITPWSHSEIIGTLPAGSYDLIVNANYSGSHTGTETYSTTFTVIAEPRVEAVVEIEPHTLNLQSKGKWITCYIWLPEDCNVADIDPNSVVLESEPNDIQADWIWFEEEEEVAMAKFSRSAVQEMLSVGELELTISGQLFDGTKFEGTDIIRVINKGSKKK